MPSSVEGRTCTGRRRHPCSPSTATGSSRSTPWVRSRTSRIECSLRCERFTQWSPVESGNWRGPGPLTCAPHDERDRHGGQPLAPSGEAESVGGGGREPERGSQRFLQYRRGLVASRTQARRRPDQLDGHVADLETGVPHQACGLPDQRDTGSTRPARVRGAEDRPQVAHTRSAEKGITDGMGDDVAVRVPVEPRGGFRPVQPGHPQRPPGPQGMDVDAHADHGKLHLRMVPHARRPRAHRDPDPAHLRKRQTPGRRTGRGSDGVSPGRSASRAQLARTSSSIVSALSSLVPSVSASSLTRIWRALESMRFSPADRPRSLSRRHRSRTTSATLFTSPDASFSRFALYRRDQFVGSSVCGARSTSNTRSSPSWPTTSRTPTISALSAGTRTVRSPWATLRTRYFFSSPLIVRVSMASMSAAPWCG